MKVINGKIVRNKAKATPIGGGTQCRLLIKKYDQRDGGTEFQYGQIDIPNEPLGDRTKLIGSLGQAWKHNSDAFLTVAAYLSHSPSFMMMRSGICSNIMDFQTGRVHTGSIEDLACYIEFVADVKGVHTTGPQWMSAAEVDVIARDLKHTHGATHDIRDNSMTAKWEAV